MTGSQIIFVIFLSASAAVISVLVVLINNYLRTRRRLFEPAPTLGDLNVADLDFNRSVRTRMLLSSVELIASRLSENKIQVSSKIQSKMMQAGLFYEHAGIIYQGARIVFATIAPLIVILIVYPYISEIEAIYKYFLIGLIYLIIAALPDVMVSRRTEAVQDQCRNGFPDFLDLMVVATEAGMSLESALSRVSAEVSRNFEYLGKNLYLTNIEIRLGRSLGDALQALADRVGIEEIRGFVTTLAQSREYGTSIADTLRVFSDDMRDRRQMTAEERAQELPVKLVFPLALFLLPVMMLIAVWPVIVRIKLAFAGG